MNTSVNSCERVLIFDMILSEQMVHMHYLSRWLVVQVKNPSLLVSFTQCLIRERQRRGTRLPRASIIFKLTLLIVKLLVLFNYTILVQHQPMYFQLLYPPVLTFFRTKIYFRFKRLYDFSFLYFECLKAKQLFFILDFQYL